MGQPGIHIRVAFTYVYGVNFPQHVWHNHCGKRERGDQEIQCLARRNVLFNECSCYLYVYVNTVGFREI